MKRLINITIIFYLVVFIYNNFSKQKELSLSFGNTINANYIYKYNDTRITDIINDINYNIKISNRNIKNLLVKASVIYIDLNDLINCYNYNCAYSNISDLEELLIIIRKYSKEKIIIKLLSNNNEITSYTNEKIMILVRKYDIITMR